MKRIFAILALAFTFAVPALAQDATPEVTPIVVDDTLTVTIETPESDTLPTLINIAIVFAGAIIAGGSAALVWDRIRRSKEAKDSIERLAEGLSPEWKSTIDKALDHLEAANKRLAELLQFGREVTDGAPNTDDPPPSSLSQPHR